MLACPLLDKGAKPYASSGDLRLRDWEIRLALDELVDSLARDPEDLGNLRDTYEVLSHRQSIEPALTIDKACGKLSVDKVARAVLEHTRAGPRPALETST